MGRSCVTGIFSLARRAPAGVCAPSLSYKRAPMRAPATLATLLAAVALLLPALSHAEAERDRFSAGGYFRIMTRPDLQGGDGRLGFWNLYGRLLNEGPHAMLEGRLEVLPPVSGRNEPWATVHARVEGGTISGADIRGGTLGDFRLSQLYVRAGNVLLDRVVWQVGTIESYFNDLGLYDMRPAQILENMVGLSARYDVGPVDVLLGVGDSGFALRRAQYSTVFTAGGSLRYRLIPGRVEVGAGGHAYFEPAVPGSRFAPYATPGVRYEDFVRREVVRHYFEENPGTEDFFPRPEPKDNLSWKAVGYLGFGGLGPLRWNNLFANYQRVHPDNFYSEQFGGRDFLVFVSDLTDQRYQINVGNEMQLGLIPNRLDAVWGVVYGHHWNEDNEIAAGEDNRRFYSTVLRLQLYLTRTTHFLVENALAREQSLNGNLFRERQDSIFANTGGIPDTRGLEYGDSDRRDTWQFKAGFVLNPTGPGIFTRPSLRLLYGLQRSSQHAAFGSGFVEDLNQDNIFMGPERHSHHVVAIEAEGWF